MNKQNQVMVSRAQKELLIELIRQSGAKVDDSVSTIEAMAQYSNQFEVIRTNESEDISIGTRDGVIVIELPMSFYSQR